MFNVMLRPVCGKRSHSSRTILSPSTNLSPSTSFPLNFPRLTPGPRTFAEDGFGELRSLTRRSRAAILALFHGLQVANKFLHEEVQSPRLRPEVMHLALDLHEFQNVLGEWAEDGHVSVLMQLLVTRLADSTGRRSYCWRFFFTVGRGINSRQCRCFSLAFLISSWVVVVVVYKAMKYEVVVWSSCPSGPLPCMTMDMVEEENNLTSCEFFHKLL